ncbi:hypothetical protein WR25_19288 [Diploscapter pachys]|uniref:SH3 domain-containing protein n=1 Tax=Diploscapter pachys TaxID=2018661 RepID=A0A2A2JUD3_9BILA|nr:hypothetical protein WR25_19288 [Diploscapter pachys]
MTVNLQKHGPSILEAYNKVATSSTGDDWLIIDYEGSSNILKIGEQGDYGVEEFSNSFNAGRLQYGVISIRLSPTVLPKVILVHWQGESVPSTRVASATSHVTDVRRFLKTVHVVVHARSEIDVDPEALRKEVAKLPYTQGNQNIESSYHAPESVNSVYRPVKPHVDINVKAREEFWSKMNNEEKERQKLEHSALAEQQRKYEEDRKMMNDAIHHRLEEEERNVQSHSQAPQEPRKLTDPPKKLVGDRIGQFERPKEIETPKSYTPPAPSVPHPKSVPEPKAYQPYEPPEPAPVSIPEPVSVPEPVKLHDIPPEPAPQLNDGVKSMAENNNKSEPEPVKIQDPVPEAPQNLSSMYDLPPPSIDTISGGLKAVALWDYQAADSSEISFDPNDMITDIEKVDEGWWRGKGPKGDTGLFPANYVQLMQ